MDGPHGGTMRVLTGFKIGRPVDRGDLLVLTIISGDEVPGLPVAVSRVIAERLAKELTKVAKKLSSPPEQ